MLAYSVAATGAGKLVVGDMVDWLGDKLGATVRLFSMAAAKGLVAEAG